MAEIAGPGQPRLSRRSLLGAAAGGSLVGHAERAPSPNRRPAPAAAATAHPPGNRVSALGASNVAAVGAGDTIELDGFVGWSWLLAGERARSHRPEAAGGYHLADVRDELLPRLLARKPRPDWCIVHAGTNDAGGGDVPAMLAIAREIYGRLLAAGVVPIATTLPPQATTGNLATLLAFNHGLAGLAGELGIPFADIFPTVVDPRTGTFAAGTHIDGVHFSAVGARRAGQAVADVLIEALPPWTPPLPTRRDAANERTLLLPNPLMLRGEGERSLPAGWRILEGPTGAAFERVPTEVGNWLQIARTGETDSTLLVTASAPVPVGHALAMGYRCEIRGIDASSNHSIQFRTDGGRILRRVGYGQGYVGDVPPHVTYHEAPMPEGAAAIELRLTVAGRGTLRIGQVLLRDLTDAEPVASRARGLG